MQTGLGSEQVEGPWKAKTSGRSLRARTGAHHAPARIMHTWPMNRRPVETHLHGSVDASLQQRKPLMQLRGFHLRLFGAACGLQARPCGRARLACEVMTVEASAAGGTGTGETPAGSPSHRLPACGYNCTLVALHTRRNGVTHRPAHATQEGYAGFQMGLCRKVHCG